MTSHRQGIKKNHSAKSTVNGYLGGRRLHRGVKGLRTTQTGLSRTPAFLLAVLLLLVTVLSGCSAASQGGSSVSPASSVSISTDSAETDSAETDSASTEESSASAEAASGNTSAEDDITGKSAAALTLMLYLCGSDLESKTGAATKDLDEIMASGVNTDLVNVVVMAGGTTKWQNGFSPDETAIYTLAPGGDTDAGDGSGLHWEKKEVFSSPDGENIPANMGEADTLQGFLDYSYAQFPAKEYALIMWNHGGGPMRGLCWDTAWAKDNLTMEEFTGALGKSPFAKEKLRWIGFDACLMSSVETAHLVTPYAKYMIASEETEPCIGWSYDFLAGIEEDGDGAVTGARIVDAFTAAGEEANKDSDKESALTLACMDLSQTENVEEKLDKFFTKLKDSLNAGSFSELSNMRQDTREFGKAMNDSQRYDLVDLGDLVGNYAEQAPEEAAELIGALEQMVVYSRSSLDNCCGLSSYHPYYNKKYYEQLWRGEYETFDFAPGYTDYIRDFADIWLSDAMGDWMQMNQVQSAGIADQTQYFSIQLTPEQLQYYASSELLILSQQFDDYSQVYRTNQVTVDENGVLTAGYNGRTLYAVDENNEVLAGPLHYTVSDDGNLLIYAYYSNQETGAAQGFTSVMFECADSPAGTNLPVLEQYVYDRDTEVWSNRLEFREDDYQTVMYIHDLKERTYDGDTIRPFSEWEDNHDSVSGYEVVLTEEIHFQFFDKILDDSTLFACFEISDTQANLYGTELMEVNNPNITPVEFENGASGTDEVYTFENDDLRMTVTGYLNSSEITASLHLDLTLENRSDTAMSAQLFSGFKMTDSTRSCVCLPTRNTFYIYSLAPGETRECDLSFDGSALAGLSTLHRISFVLNYERDGAEADTGGTEEQDTGREDSVGADNRDRNPEIVMHPVNLDLSAISGYKEYSENPGGLAESTEGQMSYTIRSVDVTREGNILFCVTGKNEGKEPAVMLLPKGMAVNDIIMEPHTKSSGIFAENYSVHGVTVAPGEEGCILIGAENTQYIVGSFDHVGGIEHLKISDILGTEGVREISSISLYSQDGKVSVFSQPEESWQESPLRFSLKNPVSLDRYSAGNVSSGDSTAEKELSEDDMTRALDSDGEKPPRTKLYSRDGVTVYGEHILIADKTVVLSLILENESDDNTILNFYGWEVSSGESDSGIKSTDVLYGNAGFISYASTDRRVILRTNWDDDIVEDSIAKISLNIRQEKTRKKTSGQASEETQNGAAAETAEFDAAAAAETAESGAAAAAEAAGQTYERQSLPSVYKATFSFADGTAFNLDGGVSLSVEETQPSLLCITEEKKNPGIFEKTVIYPENAEQYRKDYSFTLPDSLINGEHGPVSNVVMTVQKDCYPESSPEEQKELLDILSEKGYQDRTPVCLETLLFTNMSESSEKENTYTCSCSGLMCVLEKNPEFFIDIYEESSAEGQTIYTKKEIRRPCIWRLIPKESLYDGNSNPSYDFKILAEGGAAELTEFSVDNTWEKFRYPEWPSDWFDSLTHKGAAFSYILEDNSSHYLSLGGGVGLTVSHAISLGGKPQSLKMIPVKDYSHNLRVVYLVSFEDGSYEWYDGGEY